MSVEGLSGPESIISVPVSAMAQNPTDRPTASVGDGLPRHEKEEGFRETFPTAAGAITAPEFTGELIEIGAGTVGAIAQGEVQRLAVAARLRQFVAALAQHVAKAGGAGIEGVETVFP